ncbi:protein YgfX [Sansalvadorimonas verongulae]|uniref:protein YgfX n=1 Tax=Sansalvadorimonas verongulae TaxID=2172824 RepID=UPI0038B4A23E
MKGGTLDIQLGRSAVWLRLASCVHLFAAFIPLFSSVGLLTIALWPAIGFSFFYLWRRDYVRNASSSVRSLRFSEGEWTLQGSSEECSGQWLEAELTGERLITPFLTVLSFQVQIDGKKRYRRVVIFRDAVAPEPFRRLRVHLLLGGS